jgi:hypothetical protein
MSGVENVKIEPIYEYVSWLFCLGKITEDGALWLLRTYADCSQYHNAIGREINLRWHDDTGLRNAPNRLQLIRRLFSEEGDSRVEEINIQNRAFCAMSHMLMLAPELLAPAYGERAKVIEMVRHPLYMVDHYAAYLSRFDSPREFTMASCQGNTKVPWYAASWAEEFIAATDLQRAVLSITRLYPWLEKKINEAINMGLSILELSFEEAVFETQSMLKKLEDFIGRRKPSNIGSILRKQKLPRDRVSAGRGHASYGWKRKDLTERETYDRLMTNINENCPRPLAEAMKTLIFWYDTKYPSRLAEFER